MSLIRITGKFSIGIISLVYLVFSCGYVTKCTKSVFPFLTGHSSSLHATHQDKPEVKASKHTVFGNFLTRPRVISHKNQIAPALVAIVALSCFFLGYNNKKEYFFPILVYFKIPYSFNLLIAFGNFRI